MRVLNIVEAAYRGTLEEQDDTIVWICHAMKGASADIDVLLSGNAVNYAVKAQDASGLSFGGQDQTQPPQIAGDLGKLKAIGAKIYVVEDACSERGIERSELIDGLDFMRQSKLAKLFAEYDQVWHW
jgi:sulfur relay (sulfurtransferase) DsrF/TusC family protein